jgi:cytidylate kinase
MDSTNIVICGLTAAGKTTHAKLLASELGYSYVSGTATLARLCGLPVTEDPPRWSEIATAISQRRHDGIDEALEAELLRLSRERERQVFDVWALPWTSSSPDLLRIWIESDGRSRAAKCFVSQGRDPERSVEACRAFIAAKDDANRALFLRTLGFDLFRDHDVFDLILENTHFISAPTARSSRLGIAAFAPLVRAAVDVHGGLRPAQDLERLERDCRFGPVLIRRREPLGAR